MAGRYLSFGVALSAFGAVVASVSYFALFSVPFTALGVACAILGLATVNLPEQSVPKRAVRALLQGATLSIEALLEEFNADGKGVYLPPKDGLVLAYVPLGPETPSPEAVGRAPRRVVTEADGVPVLLVFPPAAEVVRASEPAGLEESLQRLLCEVTELCSSVKSVESDGAVVVEMKGVKVGTEAVRYRRALGSIPAGVAACVIAAQKGRGVAVASETEDGGATVATFRLV